MSNKERTLFNSLIKVMLRSTREEGSGFYTCVCVRSFGILGKEKKISKSRLVRFTCVCVCVCDRAVDRGERVNLCKSKWWMEGESHLPRIPQSLSLEIKVFSFSVSLTRQRKLEWETKKPDRIRYCESQLLLRFGQNSGFVIHTSEKWSSEIIFDMYSTNRSSGVVLW
jgi:hypothetical protein